MDFIGRIKFIGEIDSFTTQDNREIFSREIVLETEAKYPRRACITLRNDLAQGFNHRIGDMCSVSFDIDAFPNKEATRYFNKLTAWKIS